MQKVVTYAISLIIIVYLGVQTYNIQKQRIELGNEFGEVRAEEQELIQDQERLGEQVEYFSDPHNLEKELRARFNYRLPNEKLIIVVPEKEDATSTDE